MRIFFIWQERKNSVHINPVVELEFLERNLTSMIVVTAYWI